MEGDGRLPYPQIGLHINYEPPTRPRTLSKVLRGLWSKGILNSCFGPNLELRHEAGIKLNNYRQYFIVAVGYHENKPWGGFITPLTIYYQAASNIFLLMRVCLWLKPSVLVLVSTLKLRWIDFLLGVVIFNTTSLSSGSTIFYGFRVYKLGLSHAKLRPA